MFDVQNAVGGVVSYEESAALIEVSEVTMKIDLGHSFLYRVVHPKHGSIAVVNSASGNSGFVSL